MGMYTKKVEEALGLKEKNNNVSKIVLFTAPIVGLLAGWSNEAFAVPISGAFFVYYILRFKKKGMKPFYKEKNRRNKNNE